MIPASGVGRRHGSSCKQPFDRWFRYPAGFAHDYVQALLQHLEVRSGALVLDPFVGAGGTGAACRNASLRSFGVEAHPYVAELAALKSLNPDRDRTNELIDWTEELLTEAKEHLAALDIDAVAAETQLVRSSFDQATLLDLVAIRQALIRHLDEPWGLHLKWCLLGALRDVASVKVGWPYQRPGSRRQPLYNDAFARVRYRARVMSDDLKTIPNDAHEQIVVCGDARDSAVWALMPEQAAGSVSSPPYLNNFDYADATRLELYFWSEIRSWSEMVTTVRSPMLVASTQQSSRSLAAFATARLERLGPVAQEIQEIVDSLAYQRAQRRRGKEYDQVVPCYFDGMADVLNQVRNVIHEGGVAAWLIGDSAPYGVYIDTPGIIGRIAQELRFEVTDDVRLRHRGGRWAANSTRHAVPLSERLLLFAAV